MNKDCGQLFCENGRVPAGGIYRSGEDVPTVPCPECGLEAMVERLRFALRAIKAVVADSHATSARFAYDLATRALEE